MTDSTRFPVSSPMTEMELQMLSSHGVIKSYRSGMLVIGEGNTTDAFFIVVSGRVKVFVSDKQGREVILRQLGPGEYFGEMLLDGNRRSASVVTTEASRLVVIPKEKFIDFVRGHPEFMMQLIEKLIHRVRSLTENVKSLALMDVYGRVARLLLDNATHEGGQLIVKEKLTQIEIAHRVGSSRETINKVFKDLVAGGYISVEKKQITINKFPR